MPCLCTQAVDYRSVPCYDDHAIFLSDIDLANLKKPPSRQSDGGFFVFNPTKIHPSDSPVVATIKSMVVAGQAAPMVQGTSLDCHSILFLKEPQICRHVVDPLMQ